MLSGVVGWCIENRRKAAETTKLVTENEKLTAELKKLNTEEIKLAGDILEKVQKARTAYADACVICRDLAKALTDLVKARAAMAEINATRALSI